MEFKLSNSISESDLVEFDLYTIMDKIKVRTLKDLKDLEASESIMNFILRQGEWRGFQYDNGKLIGYGTKEKLEDIGLIETEAYKYWITELKKKEKTFKSIIAGIPQLSQTQYDALFSLYYHTGEWLSVGTNTRKFEIKQYIESKQWEYVATALILSGHQRNIRQGEAKIMMLGDYGRTKDRSVIKAEGIQRIRQLYPNRFDTPKAKEQAEYVYYYEMKRFLPKMSQARMRQVVSLYNANS